MYCTNEIKFKLNNDDVEYTITHNSDENKLETYTTWPLWIMAQKMQEAERIFNHHVYKVGATLYSR